MIDLNILKIAGAFVAGVAGVIGILGQTRTQDNKLTRSGKWLFGMAIVGVLRDSEPGDWVCAGRCLMAFEPGEVVSQRQV